MSDNPDEPQKAEGKPQEAPASTDGMQQQINFYEQYIPKREASDAIKSYIPVIDSRLDNLRWMATVSGAAFALLLGFFSTRSQSVYVAPYIVSGNVAAIVLFALAAIIFGFAYTRVTSIKMELCLFDYQIMADRLLNQPRTLFGQKVTGYLEQANKMDGAVVMALLCFVSAIVLSLFVFIVESAS